MTEQVFNAVNEIWKIPVMHGNNENKAIKQLDSLTCNTAHNDPVQPTQIQQSY